MLGVWRSPPAFSASFLDVHVLSTFSCCTCLLCFGPTVFFSRSFGVFPEYETRKCVCVCVCGGAAAADAVRGKRSKYPAAKSPSTPLVPFAVEALGRLSPEAQGLLNALAPADKKVRSQVLRTAKQTLSVLVQTRHAELLLSAEPGRGCTGPVALAA